MTGNFNTTLMQPTFTTSNLLNAAKTIDEDPEHHKLKALGAGLATAGLSIYGVNKIRKVVPTLAKAGNSKRGVLQLLTSFAVPAGIYYAIKNKDSAKDIALGSGAAIGAAYARSKFPMPVARTNLGSGAFPLIGALGTYGYMMDELGKANKLTNNPSLKILNNYPALNALPYIDKIDKFSKLHLNK